jgi:hypothetical protein
MIAFYGPWNALFNLGLNAQTKEGLQLVPVQVDSVFAAPVSVIKHFLNGNTLMIL